MQILKGQIENIDQPFTTQKGTPIQTFKFLQEKNSSFIYPQIHRNIEILEGFKTGDKAIIEYELFGKEIDSHGAKVQFNTIVVKSIIKL